VKMDCMKPLDGTRILLLEDDALISIDTQDMLISIGAAQVHVANTLDEADAIVAAGGIDAAVLDLVIGQSRCEALAFRLLALGIPLVFASGLDDRSSLPEELRRVPIVEKPCSARGLSAALVQALAARPA
jgi:DNA-binding NtrC family response regulator